MRVEKKFDKANGAAPDPALDRMRAIYVDPEAYAAWRKRMGLVAEVEGPSVLVRNRVAPLFKELGAHIAATSPARAKRREPFTLDLSKEARVFDADGPLAVSPELRKQHAFEPKVAEEE
jgi:hypothetical protein